MLQSGAPEQTLPVEETLQVSATHAPPEAWSQIYSLIFLVISFSEKRN